jgi:hypothetical protein
LDYISDITDIPSIVYNTPRYIIKGISQSLLNLGGKENDIIVRNENSSYSFVTPYDGMTVIVIKTRETIQYTSEESLPFKWNKLIGFRRY